MMATAGARPVRNARASVLSAECFFLSQSEMATVSKSKKCKNDKTRSYKGTEASPMGVGYASAPERVGTRKRGGDGGMWVVVKRSDGIKAWARASSASSAKSQKPASSAKRTRTIKRRKGGADGLERFNREDMELGRGQAAAQQSPSRDADLANLRSQLAEAEQGVAWTSRGMNDPSKSTSDRERLSRMNEKASQQRQQIARQIDLKEGDPEIEGRYKGALVERSLDRNWSGLTRRMWNPENGTLFKKHGTDF